MKYSFGGLAVIWLGAAAMLSACQYKAEPMAVPSFNVYTSYDGKLPGKYLLHVDATELQKAVKPSDFNCAAHTYPMDVREAFTGSVRQTFGNMVEELEVIQTPANRDELAARGARGMILVRAENIDGRLRAVPGFWMAGMETRVSMAASIVVDGRSGRLLGTTVEGDGEAQADAGVACEGGAASLSRSAEDALKETVTRLAEALGNSERVRTGR